ncbi:hypothetical protein DFJ58DRAFT_735200 [Suillus subalutaceus]|uniref:uncharacterized protein n=1 Tax=Suillus subalutaceus TaxID=48586 RepID=UPI001B864129|nr:uncharacterized protein DFJ58DRAFT_735200 [Suillus subalutaceus]KAG1836149.1 hypothetical protein DFJ58DRAFT_735200 [Suillus subalutaceus]
MSILPFDSTAYSTYIRESRSWTYSQIIGTTPAGKTGSQANLQAASVIAIDSDIQGDIYKLLISGIVPCPITFVFTIDEEDIEDLRPFM